MSEPWPPLPTTDGATVTVTLHPHFLHAYCSPCFICIVTSLNRIGEGVDTPLSVFVHRAVSPGWLIVRREGRCIPHAFARSRTLRRETRRQRGGGHQPVTLWHSTQCRRRAVCRWPWPPGARRLLPAAFQDMSGLAGRRQRAVSLPPGRLRAVPRGKHFPAVRYAIDRL